MNHFDDTDDVGGYNPPCPCGFHCRSCHEATERDGDGDDDDYEHDGDSAISLEGPEHGE